MSMPFYPGKMTGTASSVPVLERETVDETKGSARWMVVIHNNETNSFEEVIDILMVATGCDIQEAMTETWEADAFGKAAVHFAAKPECHRVAEVIACIGVKTEVCPEWKD